MLHRKLISQFEKYEILHCSKKSKDVSVKGPALIDS